MPRAARRDDLGAFHHVMNRGLARRPVFESKRDRRYFLSLLARAVRAGTLELHEFTLMSTHFHLLVRSVRGELSRTIGRIAWEYVRWFNRSRDRDGSLFRARFTSRRIEHAEYERAVRVYIADNAVAARLVARPSDYPWCSVHWRATRRGRRWLATPPRRCRPAGANEIEHARFMIDQRLGSTSSGKPDPWTALSSASAPALVEWLRRRARVADGREFPVPLTTPRSLAKALQAARSATAIGGAHRPRWPAPAAAHRDLHRGLLRELCGLSWLQVARVAGCSRSAACAGARRHAARLAEDRAYAERVAAITRHALAGSERRRSPPNDLHLTPRAAAV